MTSLPFDPARLRAAIPPGAAEVIARLHAAGAQAYLVGGCLRDLLLGRAELARILEHTGALVVVHDVPEDAIRSIRVHLRQTHALERFIDMRIELDAEFSKAFLQDLVAFSLEFCL